MKTSEKHMVYFISDLHLGHKSFRTLGSRNFKSIEEHDAHIVECINNTCRKSDSLFILGDIGLHQNKEQLSGIMSQMKPQLFIIKGNHDSDSTLKYLVKKTIVQAYYENKILTVDEHQFHLFHYPLRSWWGFHHNTIHLYGHSHGRTTDYRRSMDVGVDNIGFNPISYEQVIKRFEGVQNIIC